MLPPLQQLAMESPPITIDQTCPPKCGDSPYFTFTRKKKAGGKPTSVTKVELYCFFMVTAEWRTTYSAGSYVSY